MAIQVRRGNEADFDPSKMLPGEFAVSTDTRIVRICLAPGIVKDIASTEEVKDAILKGLIDIKNAEENALENIADGLDKTLSVEGKAAEAKTTGEKISQLSSEIAEFNNMVMKNNLLIGCNVIEGKYYKSPTEIASNANYSYIENVTINANETCYANRGMRFVALFDRSGEYISTLEDVENFTPTKDGYANVTIYQYDFWKDVIALSINPLSHGETIGKFVLSGLAENVVQKEKTLNVFNKNTSVNGYISDVNGTIADSTLYKTSDYIKIYNGVTYTISPKIRKFWTCGIDKIANAYDGEERTNYTFCPTYDGYMRFSYYATDENELMVCLGDEVKPHDDYGKVRFEENILLSDSMKEEVEKLAKSVQPSDNFLYGKKYVPCGDSFTEGDFTGSTSQFTFNDGGLYDGENKVYPFFIGRRNNMEVVNMAKCGMTMTNISNNAEGNFSVSRYKEIPLDADYVTLMFGINDDGSHQKATLGTIDDTDNTTFYGAWNVVMEWLITNLPYAKIGIIITNGCEGQESYPNAVREIAVKWGIPYLDIDKGEQVPLMFRTNKNTVCSTAQTIRKNAFIVSTSNQHPNEKAHEYMSTFVENWLRSL